MKKIGIDARLYSQTGVGTYLQNFLLNLDKKNIKNELYFIYLNSNDFNKINFKNRKLIKKIANQKWHSFSEQIIFLYILLKDNLDLMHFTYFSYPIFYWRKFIATVHDTTPLLFKTGKASTKNKLIYQIKHFVFKIVFWLQIHRAIKIITPTKTVKKEILRLYGDNFSNKIYPIYEGIDEKIINQKENNALRKKYKDFFIYVGNFYPHKNVENLIRAFKDIDKKYKLILIGPDDYFTNKIFTFINQSKNKNIFLIKNPPLKDLIFFYKNALAIVHPSLSEGFGLPLIEAAYFNTPIIASNIAVFKELWKDQYISFNPRDIKDIAEKIKDFLVKKPKFNYKYILKNYSFKKMTEEIIKIYSNII